jgi:ABC-type antimicrobial peptide transport system permease subunit
MLFYIQKKVGKNRMESEDRQTRKSNLRLLFEALVVGLVAGIVVGSFRWLIGQTLAMWQKGYQAAHANPAFLLLLAGGVLASVIVAAAPCRRVRDP